ncbi:OmpH family outer membrane protein [Prevotella sp.]|uniref:OmpH family outer membrane protein n=1 Tax=Prevotella sp. TaxID=59823 RepID=UPI002F93F3CE
MKKLFLMLMLLAPMAMFAQKFGRVNTQAIMQAMPELAKANGELAAEQKKYENDLKAMQDELTRKSQEYDKTKATMNATKQQETETELQTMYQKIQQTFQDNQQALQKKSNELMEPIVTKVRNAISAVGKAGAYTYILEEGSALYMGDAVKDVTADVKAQLAKMK